MRKTILNLIRFYQHHLAFDNNWARSLFITDRVCRFIPTCSEYTYEAVDKYGILKGVTLGFLRIIRCHPFTGGGFDPVK